MSTRAISEPALSAARRTWDVGLVAPRPDGNRGVGADKGRQHRSLRAGGAGGRSRAGRRHHLGHRGHRRLGIGRSGARRGRWREREPVRRGGDAALRPGGGQHGWGWRCGTVPRSRAGGRRGGAERNLSPGTRAARSGVLARGREDTRRGSAALAPGRRPSNRLRSAGKPTV